VALGLVLVCDELRAWWIPTVEAYPTGLLFRVQLRGRDPAPPGVEDGAGTWRFGVQFADGRKATTFGLAGGRMGGWERAVSAVRRTDAPPDEPILLPRGSSGSRTSYQQDYWLWPLPPADKRPSQLNGKTQAWTLWSRRSASMYCAKRLVVRASCGRQPEVRRSVTGPFEWQAVCQLLVDRSESECLLVRAGVASDVGYAASTISRPEASRSLGGGFGGRRGRTCVCRAPDACDWAAFHWNRSIDSCQVRGCCATGGSDEWEHFNQ
jgi:hypothetical protein